MFGVDVNLLGQVERNNFKYFPKLVISHHFRVSYILLIYSWE